MNLKVYSKYFGIWEGGLRETLSVIGAWCDLQRDQVDSNFTLISIQPALNHGFLVLYSDTKETSA